LREALSEKLTLVEDGKKVDEAKEMNTGKKGED